MSLENKFEEIKGSVKEAVEGAIDSVKDKLK